MGNIAGISLRILITVRTSKIALYAQRAKLNGHNLSRNGGVLSRNGIGGGGGGGFESRIVPA